MFIGSIVQKLCIFKDMQKCKIAQIKCKYAKSHLVRIRSKRRSKKCKIGFHKKPTADQLADLLTKFLAQERMVMLLKRMNFVFKDAPHKLTLTA